MVVSINFVRIRSRAESVIAKLRRSCCSAVSFLSAVLGPSSAVLSRVVIVAITELAVFSLYFT